ncbi:D-glycero-alpha-D-manno-heptose-1,7-bisphosphate 7-phosphatase [Streptomyces sp. NPDC012751]|uniref:D-glycero-alpha-D-manno-heptose-1,7-bisphosphate 7-phosphatase n=1 Tax=Streptomyces sp. NPDC012751 TaxID=3364846 RepID=UPI0036C86253
MTTVSAVLFDRDGTLVADVPYNGDPDRVRLLPGAAEAVALARSHGLATGVVSNQSGIGRGLLTVEQVRAVNARADALLGGLDTWVFCPHAPDAGCPCRKPGPGLIRTAAARLGVPPAACLVIGDIAADVLAARAAGARAVLVPNAATAPAEVARFAGQSAPDLLSAVRTALAPTEPGPPDGEWVSSYGEWVSSYGEAPSDRVPPSSSTVPPPPDVPSSPDVPCAPGVPCAPDAAVRAGTGEAPGRGARAGRAPASPPGAAGDRVPPSSPGAAVPTRPRTLRPAVAGDRVAPCLPGASASAAAGAGREGATGPAGRWSR